MNTLLHIRLLGESHLEYGATPVPAFQSPRLQSLLAYLLLHRKRAHPRQHLAFMLWPDSSEAQARTNLRKHIHLLRRSLPGTEHFLADDGSMLQWQPNAPYTLDVEHFEAAFDEAKEAEQCSDQPARRRALEKMVSLYGGELLPNCYDDWIVPDRERLRQKYIEALEQLAVLLEGEHEHRAAIGYAQRLLRENLLHEATYRHLMRLLALSGDRTGALRVYHTCVAVLQRELGVEPSAATRDTYERLLRDDYPAPQATDSGVTTARKQSHNLPIPMTSFIGREREMAELKPLLQRTGRALLPLKVEEACGDEEVAPLAKQLITLVGSAGSGKTRLALQVAHDLVAAFADGVCWVELGGLSDAALVPQTVAAALGVREQPDHTPIATLADYLWSKELLLVLDNCEHLISACAHLAEALLQSCPNLRLLATSREALRIGGELIWLVPPLSTPALPHAQHEALMESEAVRLFVERAAAVLPTFRLSGAGIVVAQICCRLDGLPLAIELAAARVRMLTLEQIAHRLDDRFRLLASNHRTALPRHQTLQAAIDWSYDLLSEPERALFRRLAVFSGGFAVEAAEAICAGDDLEAGEILDLLAHLIDKSLVMIEAPLSGVARYRLLETIANYGRDRLREAGETEIVRYRHAAFFIALAEEAEPKLTSGEQMAWLNRLEQEHDNLRAVLAWSLIEKGPIEAGLRLAWSLWRFWDTRGYLGEGRRWLERLLAAAPARTLARAKALHAVGALAFSQGDYAATGALHEESLAIGQEVGDTLIQALAHNNLGNTAWAQGEYVAAREHHAQSLTLKRELGDRWGEAASLNNLGNIAYEQGDYAQARELYTDALAIVHQLGEKRGMVLLNANLGGVAVAQGNYTVAREHYKEALTIGRELGDKWGIVNALSNMGEGAFRQGDYAEARDLYHEALSIARELGDRASIAHLLRSLGELAQVQNLSGLASSLFTESMALHREIGDKPGIASLLDAFGRLAAVRQQPLDAIRLFAAVEALTEAIGAPLSPWQREQHDRIVAEVRSVIGEDEFIARWAEGQAMTLEQAIEYALKEQLPRVRSSPE